MDEIIAGRAEIPEGEGAVVVLSGGQDSTTCLGWAKKLFEFGGQVEAVTFDYGQRHWKEIESARKVAQVMGVPHRVLDAGFINQLSPSALTRAEVEVALGPDGRLPTTFVDGRNLFLLSMAAIYAKQLGLKEIVTGVCQTDFSGYPDCRREFIDSLEVALNKALGWEGVFKIHTPLMYLTKAQSVDLAVQVGAYDALAWSHTCYEGLYPPCGACPACVLRAKGFEEAGLPDPLVVRANEEAEEVTAVAE